MITEIFRFLILGVSTALIFSCIAKGKPKTSFPAARIRILGLGVLGLGIFISTLQRLIENNTTWTYGLPITLAGLAVALVGMHLTHPGDFGYMPIFDQATLDKIRKGQVLP